MDAVLGASVRARQHRRIAASLLIFFFAFAFLLATFTFGRERRLRKLSDEHNFLYNAAMNADVVASCQNPTRDVLVDTWQRALAQSKDLPEDKFTIVILTYRRPEELSATLSNLLSTKIPSLLEVVVVWGDVDTKPPADFVSDHEVPVRYRQSKRDSLNEKLWHDPEYKTQAVLLSDDDVYYEPDDLEFVFQTWRKFGKNKMTGALARCAYPLPDGQWKYNFCSRKDDEDIYSMILTNLAFVHVSFLDVYSSSNEVPTKIRNYVDEVFNCEDIAFNFFTSLVTSTGPLLVTGRKRYVNLAPKVAISNKPGHMETRNKCIAVFSDMLGCMPLLNETAHIQRGVVVM